MADFLVGAGQTYATPLLAADAIRAQITMTQNDRILIMDAGVYTLSRNDYIFNDTLAVGFKVTLEPDVGVRHNGFDGTGVILSGTASFTILAVLENCIANFINFRNTNTAGGARVLGDVTGSELNNVLITCADVTSASANSSTFTEPTTGTGVANILRSVHISGGSGLRLYTNNTILENVTNQGKVDTSVGVQNLGTGSPILKNVISMINGTGFGGIVNAASSNNAASDATAPGTSSVQITGSQFEPDGRTPLGGGQLDGVGLNTGLVTDAAGNPYTIPYPIGAYEVLAAGGTPPTVSAGGPYSGNVGVPVQLTGTVTPGTDPNPTYLWTMSGGTGTFSDPTILNPTVTPDTGGNHTLTLTVTTNDTADVTSNAALSVSSGNIIAIPTFVVIADATPPTVLGVSPIDTSMNISINVLATATFDKAMNPATIIDGNFLLSDIAGNIAGRVTFPNNVATFTPDFPLAYSTLYTATLTTSIQDTNGIPLASNFVWSFTTMTQQVAKQINDCHLAFFKANGATSNDYDDAEYEYLFSLVHVSGQKNDMWFALLRVLGYTGDLTKMMDEFWFANGCGQ